MTKRLFFLMTYIQRRIKLHTLLQPFLSSHGYCPFHVGCAVNRIEANGHVHRLRMVQENEMDVSQLVAPSSSATVNSVFVGTVSPVKTSKKNSSIKYLLLSASSAPTLRVLTLPP